VTALTTYLQVLDSAQGEEALEPIALQTGELYQNGRAHGQWVVAGIFPRRTLPSL
jgi:hypothetical protein